MAKMMDWSSKNRSWPIKQLRAFRIRKDTVEGSSWTVYDKD